MTSINFGSVAVFSALLLQSCSGDDETGDDATNPSDMGGAASTGATGASGGTAGSGMASGGATGGMAASGMGELDDVGFENDVWPVLVTHCAGVGCHGAGSFLPEHANADVNLAFREAAPVADRIAGRVSGQLTPIMPQNCGPAPGFGMCLSLDEVALIRAWVEQGAPF